VGCLRHKVHTPCLALFAWAATGLQKAAFYKYWPYSPDGNRSFNDMEWIRDEFGWRAWNRQFEIIILSKNPEESNLLTLPAFQEMIELNDLIFNAVQQA